MVNVKISKVIYASLSTRAKEKGFSTTDKYIESILQQVAEKVSAQKAQRPKDDEEKVKARLRALGYMQ